MGLVLCVFGFFADFKNKLKLLARSKNVRSAGASLSSVGFLQVAIFGAWSDFGGIYFGHGSKEKSNRMGCGASSAATVRQAAERPAELGTDCVASGEPVVQQYKVGMKIGRGKSLTKIFPPDTTFLLSCLGASGPCRRTVEALP